MGLVEREAEMQELNAPRPGRSRDLFGVQLEVRFIWEIYLSNPNMQRIIQQVAKTKIISKMLCLLMQRGLESQNNRERKTNVI